MVKFSDLEQGDLDPKKSREARSRPSGLSFRDLEKKTQRISSRENIQDKAVSGEERIAIYDAAADYLTGVMDAVRQRRQFALESAEEIIGRIIECQSPVDPLLIRAMYQDNPQGFLIHHCVNVTVFAIKMAAALGLGIAEQEQIGLAALLHEVGMGVIPEQRIYSEHKLDEQEYAIFKKRPEFSYKILKSYGDRYAFLADTVLQVHECMDGSGYPMGLRGDEIHVYAQIIGLVDMYEALTHSRPQREKYSHFSAVKQVIKIGKRRYPKKYLKALLNIFSIFPLHSYVKLNSHAIGRVIETYPEQPLRPKIEVVFDSQGRRVLAKHVINLSENSILYVVDSVAEEDVSAVVHGVDAKPFLQTQVPDASAPEPAVILDMDAAGVEAFPGADTVAITEADPEPSPPPAGKDAPETGPGTFTMRATEAEKKQEESGDEERLEFSEMNKGGVEPLETPAIEKGRESPRRKRILLAVGMVVLAGALLWQLALKDFFSKETDQPAPIIKPSEKEVSKDRTPSVPTAPKEPAPPLPEPVSSAVPSAPAVLPPADEKKAAPPEEQPDAAQVRPETATVSAPAEEAAASLKKWERSYPFSIKLHAFRTLQETQAALPALKAKGLNPYWVKANLGSQGVWYRIFEGPYATHEQAAAVISRLGLKNAVVKETKYAVLVGTFLSQSAIDPVFQSVSDKGYCPYVIHGGDQTFSLFVGAFYTSKGAEDQVADLLLNGIQGQIVER